MIASEDWSGYTLRPMAGCPIRRARKAAARTSDSSLVAFPHLHHPRAGLSHAEWRALSPSEKLEGLLGMSLDQLAEILSWPVAVWAGVALRRWLLVRTLD